MAKEIKFLLTADTSNAVDGIKKVGSAAKDLSNTSNKTSNDIAKGFIKASVAIQAAKIAFRFAADSLKEFEKAGGDAGLKKINEAMGNLKVQIGSVLGPIIKQFADFVVANFDKIASFVRQSVALIIGSFYGLQVVIELIKMGFAKLGVGVNNVLADMIDSLKWVYEQLGKIPGKVGNFYKSAAEGLGGVSDGLRDSAKYWDEFGKESKKNLISTIIKINELKANAAKGTTLKFKVETEKKKAPEKDLLTEALRGIDIKAAEIEIDKIKSGFEDVVNRFFETGFYRREGPKFIQVTFEDMLGKFDEYKDKLISMEWQLASQRLNLANLTGKELEVAETKFTAEALQIEYNYEKNFSNTRTEFEKKYIDNRKATSAKSLSLIEASYSKIGGVISDGGTYEIGVMHNNVTNKIKLEQSYYNQRVQFLTDNEQKIIDLKWYEGKSTTDAEQYFQRISEENERTHQQVMYELRMQQIQTIVSAYSTVVSSLGSMFSEYQNLRMMEIDKDTQKRKEWAKDNIRNKKALSREIEAIDKEAAEKERKLKKQQMMIQLLQTVGSVAQGVANALASFSPPFNFVMAAIVGALGAVQIGLVAAQLAKFQKGGIVGGNTTTGDRQLVRANSGELILNQHQQARLLYEISNNRMRAQTTPAQIRTGDVSIVVQGNADEAMLGRVFAQSREQQIMDLRQIMIDMQSSGYKPW
jgi:hypothetical protein